MGNPFRDFIETLDLHDISASSPHAFSSDDVPDDDLLRARIIAVIYDWYAYGCGPTIDQLGETLAYPKTTRIRRALEDLCREKRVVQNRDSTWMPTMQEVSRQLLIWGGR